MSEDEKQLVKKFKNLYTKDFNNEHITSNDRLSYIECALLTELIEKLEKELQQEKEWTQKAIEYGKFYRELYNDAVKETNERYISKDKIRELLKKYDTNIAWANADDHYYFVKFINELLEQ